MTEEPHPFNFVVEGINARSAQRRKRSDRQVALLVGYIWLAAIAIIFVTFSVPRATEAFHQQELALQEITHHG